MSLSSRAVRIMAVAALGPCATIPPPSPAQNGPFAVVVPQDLFARVNGVTLHYLDWGGKGDLCLFLPGASETAHTFDGIAPAFTDWCHAMGLTRRGHGASEKPETGYDLETLVKDIVAFLNAVGAKRTIVVGHSFAGVEMPTLAALLPGRVVGLVFLDAVYDWQALVPDSMRPSPISRFFEPPDTAFRSRESLEEWFRRRDPELWGPARAADLRAETYLRENGRIGWQLSERFSEGLAAIERTPIDYSGIRVPTLVIWANQTSYHVETMKSLGYSPSDIEAMRKWASVTDVGDKQRGIEALKKSVPNATVVQMQAPHLLHWYRPQEVIRFVRHFIGEFVH